MATKGLDNKISNIIGAKLPQWVLDQLGTRSNKNTQDSRDNDNLLYLVNKSAWVRLVSSIDIKDEDLRYFKKNVGDTTITKENSLAKEFVLFGGTSKYLDKNSYQQRAGLGKDGAYGILGEAEIQKYGYRPMPGITSVNIETQGRLGSIRAATINFKCWDKNQLDIMDALYFKLGFTMFLEWGHTFFYPNPQNSQKLDPNKIQSTELYSIDPFQENLNKEDILSAISQNSRNSQGNYDAMLGITTNFNFTYNQDGGYDCSVRLMALGILGDSIKINNPGVLPDLLTEEILQLNNTLLQISQQQLPEVPIDPLLANTPDPTNDILANLVSGLALNIPGVIPQKQFSETDLKTIAFANNNLDSQRADKRIREALSDGGDRIAIFPYTADFKIDNLVQYNSLDKKKFYQLDYYMGRSSRYIIGDLNLVLDQKQTYTNIGIDIPALKERNLKSFPGQAVQPFFQIVFNTEKAVLNKDASSDRQVFGAGTGDIVYYKYVIQYKNSLGKQYFFTIELDPGVYAKDPITGASYELLLNPKQRKDIIENILSNGENVFRNNNLAFSQNIFSEAVGWPFFSYQFNLQLKYDYNSSFKDPSGNQINLEASTNALIKFNDSSLFTSDIIPSNDTAILTSFGRSIRDRDLTSQNINNVVNTEDENKAQQALSTQIAQALNYQSSLEIMLRTIEVHALNKAINQKESPDLTIGKRVYTNEFWKDKSGKKQFAEQIFSSGVFSTFIKDLINNDIKPKDIVYTTETKMDPLERFRIQSKYGFSSNLMGNKAALSELAGRSVDFKELLRAFVVPYQINQEIIKGTQTNHPVYIQLGLLLMILNHTCTIYDTKKDFQTPLVYIDFNPELNFFLTNSKQLSTNPWKTLIPFEGTFEDYKQLFDKDILDGEKKDAIKPPSGSIESTPLFNPKTDDKLSGSLPKLKKDKLDDNVYRGKMMNILLNIDYLVNLTQQYSAKDSINNVYLKPFLEQLLSDLNKYLGNFNAFRLSYSDAGNTFQITDDQFVPSLPGEDQISPTNRTEIPLVGKFSIAKSLEIKTEMSSKLANMLAISANSTVSNKSTLSTNASNVGYINTNYTDRYITDRQEPTGSTNKSRELDTLKTTAAEFNQTISDFYSKINPSEATVSHATSYYIDKMSRIKNDDYATRASAMIPVSLNFTTDGIAGMSMGQAFTVSEELLPYTYTTKKVAGAPTDYINKVGFVMVGLTHTIESNQWNTAVRANMIFLKDATAFTGSVSAVEDRVGEFGIDQSNEFNTSYVGIEKSPPINSENAIKIAKTFFEQRGYTPVQVSAIIGALLQESQLNPNALNSIGAYGIAQWLGGRKNILLAIPDYQKLETQLAFIIQEFNSTEVTAGKKLKAAITLEDAITAMATYERYAGVTSNSTYQDVLVAAETGNRIGYTKNIYKNYYS
jgi:hypothetical protein